MNDEEFTFINKHQLMATRIGSELVRDRPYFHQMGVLFDKFVIDTSQYYDVYFIATSECTSLSLSHTRVSLRRPWVVVALPMGFSQFQNQEVLVSSCYCPVGV